MVPRSTSWPTPVRRLATRAAALAALLLAAPLGLAAQQPDLPAPVTPRPDRVLAGGLELNRLGDVRRALAAAREARATLEREQRQAEPLYLALGAEIAALEDREAMELEKDSLRPVYSAIEPSVVNSYVRDRDNARKGVQLFLENAVTVPLSRLADDQAVAAEIADRYQPAFEAQNARLGALRAELQAIETRKARIPAELGTATEKQAASQTALAAARAQRADAANISERERNALDDRIRAYERASGHWTDKLRWLNDEREPTVLRQVGVKALEVELADYLLQLRQKELDAARKVLNDHLDASREEAQTAARVARKELAAAGSDPEFRRIQLREELAAEELELEVSRLREQRLVDNRAASDAKAEQAELVQKDQRWRERYKLDASEQPSGAEAEEAMNELRGATTAAEAMERLLDGRRFVYKARSENVRAELETFDSRTLAIVDEAQAAYDKYSAAAPPDARPPAWNTVAQDLRDNRARQRGQLDVLYTELEAARGTLRDDALVTIRATQQTRRELRSLLQRQNITLRSESNISVESLQQGLRDLAALPGYLGDVANAVGGYLIDPEHSDGILAYLGLLLVGAVVAVLLRRRLRTWIDHLSALKLADRSERAALTAAYLLRALVLSAYLALLFAGATWILAGLPPAVETLLWRLGFLVGAFWFARRANLELFAPEPRERGVLELDPADARRMFVAVGLLLYATLIALPLPIALQELGYRNKGLLELLGLIAKVAVAVVALVVVSRQSLWATVLPSTLSGPARLLRLLGRAARRVVMLLIPTLVLLDVLQFDILSGLITRVAVVVLAVSLAGFLIYQLGLFVVDRLMLPQPEKRESAPNRRHRESLRETLHFALLIGLLFGGMNGALRLSGSTLDDLKSFFDVRLPLTGESAAGIPAVTWWNLIYAGFLIWFFVALTARVKLLLHDVLLPGIGMDAGLRYTLTTLTGYLLLAAGIYLALTEVFDLANLGYVLAAFSVGLGFGLQEIVSNFVSGLILLFERPLRVGDMVQVGETLGTVQKINIRATTVQTLDNVWILVPNKDFITQNVVNYVYIDAKLRCQVPVGVAYGSDTDLVKKALTGCADRHPLVLKKPATEVRFDGFGDSSLNFTLMAWINDPFDRPRVISDLNFAVDAAFREVGVEIPFPQRDLHIRSADVALRVAQAGAEPPPAAADA